MGDVGNKDSSGFTKIVGSDEAHAADVTKKDGVRRLETESQVTVENLLGTDPFPDTWFRVDNAGVDGDSLTIDIAATSNDPTTPDRDAPSVSETVNVTTSEEGDELALRDKVITELRNNSNFTNSLEVNPVPDTSIIHISSKFRGDFWERPNAGDFSVSTTGNVAVTVGFDNVISRGKSTSLQRDPNFPHALGQLGISGQVNISSQVVTNFQPQFLNDSGGSEDMRVDGSSTPVEFNVQADPDKDFIITDVQFIAQDGNIVMDRFMDTVLTNGFLFEIISDGDITQFPSMVTTADTLGNFTSPGLFEVIISNKAAKFTFDPTNPFILKAGTNDKVSITVRDDVTGMVFLKSSVEGFLKE